MSNGFCHPLIIKTVAQQFRTTNRALCQGWIDALQARNRSRIKILFTIKLIKMNKERQVGTAADSSIIAQVTTSSQPCTKPTVSSSYLSVKQVNEACNKHAYLLFRFGSGYQMGINGKVARLARKRKQFNDNDETDFVSYIPCGLDEYIEHKHPFY